MYGLLYASLQYKLRPADLGFGDDAARSEITGSLSSKTLLRSPYIFPATRRAAYQETFFLPTKMADYVQVSSVYWLKKRLVERVPGQILASITALRLGLGDNATLRDFEEGDMLLAAWLMFSCLEKVVFDCHEEWLCPLTEQALVEQIRASFMAMTCTPVVQFEVKALSWQEAVRTHDGRLQE